MNILKKGILLSIIALAANASQANETYAIATIDVSPEYPQSAMRRETSGYVEVQFDVNKNGKAENVRIVSAYPNSSFNGAVMTAVRRSNFQFHNAAGSVENTAMSNIRRTYRFQHTEDIQSTALTMN